MAGYLAPFARALEPIHTRAVSLTPSLWPDCPVCGCDVVRCDCDPEAYRAGVSARLSQEATDMGETM